VRRTLHTVLLLLVGAAALAQDAAPGTRGQALLLEVKGPIGPAVSDFVVRGIEQAEHSGAKLVILRMDTPGGLDTSMRTIIHKILASSVPVATYVAPGGSRAASAGTYILYASHIAAMAPATNLGAATPVQIGGPGLPGGGGGEPEQKPQGGEQQKQGSEQGQAQDEKQKSASGGSAMEHKIVNDAVAYIRGLAKLRGRNAEWAEQAVREAASLTAEDALQKHVIDVIAPDVDSLLAKIDGRTVQVNGHDEVLHTKDLTVRVIEPDWRTRLLAIITNPNVAYILMLLGVYGLFFELANPGSILPGVLGAISLLLALYAFQVLPVNYAGLGLILLGIAFMVAEVFVPSFGALGIGGAVAFVVGSVILMETEVQAYTISMPLIVVVALVSVAFFISVMTMAVRQRKRGVVSGQEHMIGNVGEAVDEFDERGRVWLEGELWDARTSAPVARGQRVRVRSVHGLTLDVEPLSEEG
jgi:membrane-bound serine protease (ClpP class)